jgi:hypothetical protein
LRETSWKHFLWEKWNISRVCVVAFYHNRQ